VGTLHAESTGINAGPSKDRAEHHGDGKLIPYSPRRRPPPDLAVETFAQLVNAYELRDSDRIRRLGALLRDLGWSAFRIRIGERRGGRP